MLSVTSIFAQQKKVDLIINNAKVLDVRNGTISNRLRNPEFEAALKTAGSLGIRIYGHIGDFSPEYKNGVDQL